ncbi:cell division protein FtsX [Helicobacter sp. MIT 14-3879]|uniref:cell division protein FtsX n=1 Tax=Helicobacter sp. MIT 14-3879 TaxID=2040649 RepID=UPI000E1F24B3|nr:cell division protein FtsX [Helicobacter sp. MIT 14-3879]RDU64734.1 cell division protein FtsX [Helicobacter sp. MIT 14-3879]
MRWIKQYLSLLIPLIALLVGIESILVVNRAVNSHEELIGKNYAIVIVSNSNIDINNIKEKIPEVSSIIEIDSSAILNDINAQFKDSAFNNLKPSLPLFYSLKLNTFPNHQKIKKIEQNLKNIENIIRVESFSKSHSQTYKILVLLKGCVLVLSSLIFILSLLLMIKQIEVWRFEHSERMEIMTYFGAPSKFKNAPLYKLALIDSIIASISVILAVIFLANSPKITLITSMLGIEIFNLNNFITDYLILLASAYIISMLSVFMVILFQKEP